MGTTSEKLTYLNTTKGKIKDSINLTGANITTEPFRQYSTKLEDAYVDIINNGTDTLYNNFPKVSGEGTSLTLNNTYQAPMRNNLKGNTSQTGTPTPTSPIPVNVVSGDNEINVCGKNVINSVEYNRGIASNGNINNNSQYLGIEDYVRIEPSTTYTITFQHDNGGSAYVGYREKDGTFISRIGLGSARTFTTPSNAYYLFLYVYSSTGFDTVGGYVQLEKGNTSSTYEPYQGDTYNIDLPVENLLPYPWKFTSGSSLYGITITDNRDGKSFKISGTATSTVTFELLRDTNKQILLDDTPYYLQGGINNNVRLYFNGGNMDTGSGATYTYPSSSTSTRLIGVYITSGTTVNETIYPMLVKGSKPQKYTPYGTTPIELCKIGNYQDKFLRSNGTNLAPNNLSSETYNSLKITNNNNGTFTLLGNPTGSFGRDIATNLTLKAGTYTISANEMPSGLYIALDNEADTQLSNGTLSKTFTLASDTTYTSLGIWFTKNKDYDVTIQLMINEGSSASEWQPYGVGEWYLHKEIGKVVLNGSSGSYSTPSTNRFNIDGLLTNYYKETGANTYLSNYYQSYNQTINNGDFNNLVTNVNYGFNMGSSTGNAIRFKDTRYTSTDDFKSSLSTNNVTIYYALATPTSEGIPTNLINQIEQFYQAQSKNNQTNISQINNDLGFIISASALKKG